MARIFNVQAILSTLIGLNWHAKQSEFWLCQNLPQNRNTWVSKLIIVGSRNGYYQNMAKNRLTEEGCINDEISS